MTSKGPVEPASSFLDRLFLYGIRSVRVVLAVVVFGASLVAHGWLVDRCDYLASGGLIIMICVGLALAFQQLTTTLMSKRHYAVDTPVWLVGLVVVVMSSQGMGAG